MPTYTGTSGASCAPFRSKRRGCICGTAAASIVVCLFVHVCGSSTFALLRRGLPGSQLFSRSAHTREANRNARVAMACSKPRFPTVAVLPSATGVNNAQSSYRGVSWHHRSHRWLATLMVPDAGVNISLGLFDSEREAAKSADRAQLVLQSKFGTAPQATSFPVESYTRSELVETERWLKSVWRPRPSGSYHGVYQTRGSSNWKGEIELYGIKQLIGYFDGEVEAAHAVDAALRSTGAERAVQLQNLNFIADSDYFNEETWDEEMVPRDASSRFLGVTFHQRTGQYLAKLGRKHVGLFPTEVEAAMAFDRASLAVGGATNFKPKSLSP